MPAASNDDILQGTLDMLVLKALQLGALHGWGITERLGAGSAKVLKVGQGSLYPALYRLERQGFVTSEWRMTENNRRARIYEITEAGRKQLKQEESRWRKVAAAVGQVLQRA